MVNVDNACSLLVILSCRCANSCAVHYSGARAKCRAICGGDHMNWPDLSMGGYGFYVWGAYLFSLFAIVWELVSLSYRKKAQAQEKTSRQVLRGNDNETTS